ncbi:MAG: type II toxin-antitoxin system prevent-host-death family antitoxin [Thermoanaerobaculia bacterium]|nr:type II toxin-antitoxin system prevent-host-death family antitoxin [Thermoanaerobaculia bacterium]
MTRITATEASRSFSELLNRARYGGESFVVVRGGEEMAQITPPSGKQSLTLGQLFELLDQFPADPTFADDLEVIQSQQGLPPRDPWST